MKSLLNSIQSLESISEALEPSLEQRNNYAKELQDFTNSFMEIAKQIKIRSQERKNEVFGKLPKNKIVLFGSCVFNFNFFAIISMRQSISTLSVILSFMKSIIIILQWIFESSFGIYLQVWLERNLNPTTKRTLRTISIVYFDK